MTQITHLNPLELHTSSAFSQGTISETGRTIYVGGQNGTDERGAINGGIADQTQQALRNVLAVLAAAGAGPEHVAKMTIYLAGDADVRAAFNATVTVWGSHPTAITVLRVLGLARPDALIEIDATAVIP